MAVQPGEESLGLFRVAEDAGDRHMLLRTQRLIAAEQHLELGQRLAQF